MGKGYGGIVIRGENFRAHRLQWERYNGPIPKGLFVCHKCDVRSCINPEHLFLATNRENILDASRKGRMAHGENHYFAKMNKDQVFAIFNDQDTKVNIAKEYGVCTTTIENIKNGTKWAHLKLLERGQ